MLRIFTYLLLTLALIGVGILAGQNQQLVNLRFLNLQSIGLPLGLVLISSGGLGSVFVTTLQVIARNNQVIDVDEESVDKEPQFSKSRNSQKVVDFDDEFDDAW